MFFRKILKLMMIFSLNIMMMGSVHSYDLNWECLNETCQATGFFELSDLENEINSVGFTPAHWNSLIKLGTRFSNFKFTMYTYSGNTLTAPVILPIDFNTPWDENRPLYPQLIERSGNPKFIVNGGKVSIEKIISGELKIIHLGLSFVNHLSQESPIIPVQPRDNLYPIPESNCLFSTANRMRGDTNLNRTVEMVIPLNISCQSQHTVNLQVAGDASFQSATSTLINSSGDVTQVFLTLRDNKGQDADKISTNVDINQPITIDIVGKATPSKSGYFVGKGFIKVIVN